MTEVALGIDVGTSGVRIAARDRDGNLKAMSQAAMAARLPILAAPCRICDLEGRLAEAFKALDLSGLKVLAPGHRWHLGHGVAG